MHRSIPHHTTLFPAARHGLLPLATLLLLGVLLFARCAGKNRWQDWQEEHDRLLQRAVDLEQHHCRLQASIDSLWDATSALLAQSMPPDFPDVDREIFRKARNADHIRMMMSYEKLDPGARALVNRAGERDQALAVRVHSLLEQKRAFEEEKNRFLRQVHQEDPEVSRVFTDRILAATAAKCR
jgi:hypothetical protein